VAFGEVVFVVENGDVLAYEAVCDSFSAVERLLDAVLYLGVSDGCVVSDARVGVDERVGAELAAVSGGAQAYVDVVLRVCLYVCYLVGRGVFHHHRFGSLIFSSSS